MFRVLSKRRIFFLLKQETTICRLCFVLINRVLLNLLCVWLLLKEGFDCGMVTSREVCSLPAVASRPLLLNVYAAVNRGV